MTSPGDDDLEAALRRALSAAAGEVEPGADGLDKIRARIGGRQPRPWLFSVFSGVVDRVRHWTWIGHWAWRDSPARLRAFWERRSRRSKFPRRDIGWLRPVTALAGVALIAGVMVGVQPVRQAILQARTSMDGGESPAGNVGTEGNGTPVGGGGAPTADGATPGGGETGQAGSAPVPGESPTPAAHSASSTGCVSSVLPVVADAEPSQASVAPEASATASATQALASASPTSSSATPAQPYYANTSTDAPTCPVAPLTSSPAPTPADSSSPAPTPSDVPSTPAYTPPMTDPSPEPTPTAGSPSPTADPPSWRPSDPPTSGRPGRPGKPGKPRRPHHESGDQQSGDRQSGRR
jgi:hypothetical protein